MYWRMAASKFDASENTPSNTFVGKLGEPAFHQVDPGTIGRGEMDMKARSFGEPVPNQGRLVSAVVVGDQMNLQIGRHLRFDPIQKLAELPRAGGGGEIGR